MLDGSMPVLYDDRQGRCHCRLGLQVCATKEPFREASCILTEEDEAICVHGSLGKEMARNSGCLAG